MHRDVLLEDAFIRVRTRIGAAVAVALAVVRDVAEAPLRRLAAIGPVQHLGADVHGTIAVVYRTRPVMGPVGVDGLALYIVMGLAGRRSVGVVLGKGEGDVEQHELVGRVRSTRRG